MLFYYELKVIYILAEGIYKVEIKDHIKITYGSVWKKIATYSDPQFYIVLKNIYLQTKMFLQKTFWTSFRPENAVLVMLGHLGFLGPL